MKNKQLSPQLVKLLRKVRAFILKNPSKFNQNRDEAVTRQTCTISRCGTAQCILGWMRLIYRGKKRVEDLFPSEGHADTLYYASQWPHKFQIEGEYDSCDWSKITAKTAAKRITHYIRTDGRQ